jgi:hypothetical protein
MGVKNQIKAQNQTRNEGVLDPIQKLRHM